MTNFKVGDEIAFGRYHLGLLIGDGASIIANINRHGHVLLENGLVFDKHGRERNNEYSALFLMPVADRQKYLDAQKARVECMNTINQIKKLVDSLNSNGGNDSTKTQLIELINSL